MSWRDSSFEISSLKEKGLRRSLIAETSAPSFAQIWTNSWITSITALGSLGTELPWKTRSAKDNLFSRRFQPPNLSSLTHTIGNAEMSWVM